MRAPVRVPGLGQRFHHEAFTYYDRLTPVLQFVNAHITKPISLDTAAKVAGLERKYFSAFFHSKVGLTFTEWIRILRVERGMELMRAHDDSIPRIAFAAGFRDVRTPMTTRFPGSPSPRGFAMSAPSSAPSSGTSA